MTPWTRHRLLVIKNHRPKPIHYHEWEEDRFGGDYFCIGCQKRIRYQDIVASGSWSEAAMLFTPVNTEAQLHKLSRFARPH